MAFPPFLIDAKPTEKAKTETKMSKLCRQKNIFLSQQTCHLCPKRNKKTSLDQKERLLLWMYVESSSIHVSLERGVPGGWCNPLGDSGGGVGRLGAFFDGY